MKLNNLWLGFIVGMILPVITFLIFFAHMSNTKDFSSFISQLKAVGIETSFYSFAALPSFFAFFAFYWKKYNRSAMGVVLAALIITFAIVVSDL